jgi:hypothetical protein
MQTPSIEALSKRLPVADRMIILGRAHASIALSLHQVTADMAALVRQASDEEVRALAEALGGSPNLIRAITEGINVVTLLEGMRVLEYLEDLPVSGVADVAEARQNRGPDAWRTIARCLVHVGHDFPLDGPVWTTATPNERAAFAEALAYAQTLLATE